MSTAEIKLNLFRQIDSLPDDALQKISMQVQQYLDEGKHVAKKQREFGSMKGLVLYMADDFDAPLQL